MLTIPFLRGGKEDVSEVVLVLMPGMLSWFYCLLRFCFNLGQGRYLVTLSNGLNNNGIEHKLIGDIDGGGCVAVLAVIFPRFNSRKSLDAGPFYI